MTATTIDQRSPWDRLGWAMVPHALTRCPEISDGAFRTYVALMEYWQAKPTCWPSMATMMEHRGRAARNTLRKHLQELEAVGLITRERKEGHTTTVVRKDIRAAFEPVPWYRDLIQNRFGEGGQLTDRGGQFSEGGQLTDRVGGQKTDPEEEQLKKNNNKSCLGEELAGVRSLGEGIPTNGIPPQAGIPAHLAELVQLAQAARMPNKLSTLIRYLEAWTIRAGFEETKRILSSPEARGRSVLQLEDEQFTQTSPRDDAEVIRAKIARALGEE